MSGQWKQSLLVYCKCLDRKGSVVGDELPNNARADVSFSTGIQPTPDFTLCTRVVESAVGVMQSCLYLCCIKLAIYARAQPSQAPPQNNDKRLISIPCTQQRKAQVSRPSIQALPIVPPPPLLLSPHPKPSKCPPNSPSPSPSRRFASSSARPPRRAPLFGTSKPLISPASSPPPLSFPLSIDGVSSKGSRYALCA